jgi:hypothetical protein
LTLQKYKKGRKAPQELAYYLEFLIKSGKNTQ